MTDMAWAVLTFDDRIKERRLVGVYRNPEHANLDAVALQTGSNWVTVEPYEILSAPQVASTDKPAEHDASDFDVPVHVDGEVTR